MKNLKFFDVTVALFFVVVGMVSIFQFSVIAQTVDRSFLPTIEKRLEIPAIGSQAVQSDGKLIVSGGFAFVDGKISNLLVRLDSNGTVDETFQPGSAPKVAMKAIAVQPDGKIIMGGDPSSYVTDSSPFVSASIVRLNPDGSYDPSFRASGSVIRAIAVQSDGKILIGVDVVNSSGVIRRGITRLNASGSLDTTFNPGTGASEAVKTIAVQSDGKILIGGNFTTFNGTPNAYLLRLNTDGSIDSSFNVGTGTQNTVSNIALQPDGKILVAGNFTAFNGIIRYGIARLDANGALDNSFSPFFDVAQSISGLRIQPDGKIITHGNFTLLTARQGIVRLNTDGTSDTAFNVGVGTGPTGVTFGDILPNGKVAVSGNFSNYNGVQRQGIALLNTDGTLDNSFSPRFGIYGTIYDLTKQSDGKIIIGGDFDRISSAVRKNIARLNADGTVDTNFNVGTGAENGVVNSVFVENNSKILIGGNFSIYNGTTRQSIARLNPEGSLDTSFNANVTTTVVSPTIKEAIVLTNGKVLIGGDFRFVDGLVRDGFAQLNSDGSVDSAFLAGVQGGRIFSILSEPDGKITIGGSFGIYAGVARSSIARVNADGTLDTSFNPGSGTSSSAINSMVRQSDGKIVIGGEFFTYNGTARMGIARINQNGSLDTSFVPSASGFISSVLLDTNGKVYVAGDFTVNSIVTRLARLNSDGSLDGSFTPFQSATRASIYTLGFDSTRKLLVGGAISTLRNTVSTGISRIDVGLRLNRVKFDYDGDGKSDVSVFRPSDSTWYLQNSSNGFSAVRFGIGTDKIVPADYDGDGKTDVAVFRGGTWYILNSSNNSFIAVSFGDATDKPTPDDYDGDGKADISVYRPSNGTWYRLNSSNNSFQAVNFGIDTDIPTVGDYDGDGKADIAVYRRSDRTWYQLRSQAGFQAVTFGITTDVPIPADYDGDGKTDVAVYRDGIWYLLNSTGGFTAVSFGTIQDAPVVADYDGDGKADPSVFRPTNSFWYELRSLSGFNSIQFGTTGDIPTESAYLP
jgi:uncharacterized delta-60 repeat protein